MQIWTPKLLEASQQSQGQAGEHSQYQLRRGSIVPSTAQSLTKSFTTSHTSHIAPITDESAIAFRFEMPGVMVDSRHPNITLQLSLGITSQIAARPHGASGWSSLGTEVGITSRLH